MQQICFRCFTFLLISKTGGSGAQRARRDFNRSFHAGRVQLTDNNQISAAGIDFLSHLYLNDCQRSAVSLMEQLGHQQSDAEVLNAAPSGGTRVTRARLLEYKLPPCARVQLQSAA